MDCHESKEKSEPKVFRWDTRHSRYLCKYLADQTKNGMKADKGFRTTCLKQLVKAINEEFKVDIQVTNVRNHLRTLRDKWEEINRILKNSSGAHVDYERGIIEMDASMEDDYIKAHPKSAFFINKTIDNFNELILIFSGDRATREYCVNSRLPRSSSNAGDDIPTLVESHDFPIVVGLDSASHCVDDDIQTPTKSPKAVSSSKNIKNKSAKRSRALEDPTDQFSVCAGLLSKAIRDAGKEMSINIGISKDIEYSKIVLKEFMKLGSKSGMGKRELFIKAKKLVSSPDDVKFFLALDDDDLRMEWLEIFFDDIGGDAPTSRDDAPSASNN